MRTLHTHQSRAAGILGTVRTYIPSTYTVVWPNGAWTILSKSGWHWSLRDPDGYQMHFRQQAEARDVIANLGGTITLRRD